MDGERLRRPAAVDVKEPARQTLPLVLASPHSGSDYPADFIAASRLDPLALRRSEDSFVDELFAAAPRLGAPLLAARFPRAYLDPNREAWELDPAMFADALPDFVNAHSPRVRMGLGTIARIVASGEEIYARKLRFAEAQRRIEELYWPYHQTLERLLAATERRFGGYLLLDCHSMPSAPWAAGVAQTADIVLGDYHGKACAPQICEATRRFLVRRGFSVALNTPYAGGFTTEHYGRPARCRHALQIEISRALYMDEQSYRKRPPFDRGTGAVRAPTGQDRPGLPAAGRSPDQRRGLTRRAGIHTCRARRFGGGTDGRGPAGFYDRAGLAGLYRGGARHLAAVVRAPAEAAGAARLSRISRRAEQARRRGRRHSGFPAPFRHSRTRHRMAHRRGARPCSRRDLFRPSRPAPLPFNLLHPAPRSARLPAGARRLPRHLRPCADADEPGFRRLHAGLWRGRAESAAIGASAAARPALLVYGRVRPDCDPGRAAHLRVGHPVLGRRIGLLPRRSPAAAIALRSQTGHAHALPDRRLPTDLFCHRQFRGAVRGDKARFHSDLSRARGPARSRPRGAAARGPGLSSSSPARGAQKNWAAIDCGPSLGRKRLEDVRQDHNR